METELGRDGKYSVAGSFRKGDLYRVIGERGEIAASFGTEGVIAWIGVTGNPKAWSSSPDRMRVARVGLRIEGRKGYLFCNACDVVRIERPITEEDRIMMDAVIGAFSRLAA